MSVLSVLFDSLDLFEEICHSISRNYIITLTLTVRLCGDVKKVVIDFHILVDVRLIDNFLKIEWVIVLVGNTCFDEFSN